LLSEFVSNTAATALLVPVFAALAPELGLPRETLIVLVALSASCGFALPVATPPNALVYGCRQFPLRTMLGVGLSLDLVCVTVFTGWCLLMLA
jgi:sodium-dependent dicarboxylate transporter 2/3/5